MSDFKDKVHQIRFRLGLCPRSRWGSLQRSPDPLAGFKGGLLLTLGGWDVSRRREEGRKGERKGRRGKRMNSILG